MKNPKDIKHLKDLEDQDPRNAGWRNYARVAGDSKEERARLKTRLRKKLRIYLGLGLAHNSLNY